MTMAAHLQPGTTVRLKSNPELAGMVIVSKQSRLVPTIDASGNPMRNTDGTPMEEWQTYGPSRVVDELGKYMIQTAPDPTRYRDGGTVFFATLDELIVD